MAERPIGVLVMAYGTPATPDDVEAYYTHIRRGRPPTPELLSDLQGRYRAIGGTSPMLELTRRQAAGLQIELGDGYRVELGMKHAPPFIEDGVAALAAAGVERTIGLVLAPHYSAMSVGEYAARAPGVDVIEQWWDADGYLDLLVGNVRSSIESLPPECEVVFTAHSLPTRILEAGDPYAKQVRATAEAVAARAGLTQWSQAWQSAARAPASATRTGQAEQWLGPDILEVLDDRAAAGTPGVLVCPCGFVSDHLEILYDLDIAARARAAELRLAFGRTALPNDAPVLLQTLAGIVRAHG